MGWFIFGVLSLIGAGVTFFMGRGEKAKSTAMAVADTHTAQELNEIHSRVVGTLDADALAEQCEITGVIECDTPLTAPLSKKTCVAYNHTISREYEEEVTETDSDGKRKTSTRRGSETVESNNRRVKFWVRDSSGQTLVDPEGAAIDLRNSGERFETADDDERGSKRRRTLGYRTTESILSVGSPVYVLGCAVDFQGQPMMSHHPRDKTQKFIISWKSEQELVGAAESGSRNLQITTYVLVGLGMLLIVLGFIF